MIGFAPSREWPTQQKMTFPMNSSNLSVNDLGSLLRHWRRVRGKSQIDLSMDTDVSQRHISFIESGRSIPSRETLIDIAKGLDIPLRDRNTLLLAAGYAPTYSEVTWNS
jgi:transcriptional regulator with XRE-family HTH domain